jgi:hypothetical protein
MKRLAFLASLFGFGVAAKAQHPVGVDEPNTSKPADSKFLWPWVIRKPENNQCPVCGTMAEPYRTLTEVCNKRTATAWFPEWPTCVELGDPRLTRCSRCNAAFFQDAQ